MESAEPRIEPPRYLRFLIVGRHGSTLRPVLLFGFAVIFGLWLVSAYDLVQRVGEGERQSTAITARFIEGEELLFTVRTQVFLSSVYVRDAALDARADAASFYRDELRTRRAEVEQALERYLPDVDSRIEREHWTRLQDALQAYWNSVSPMLRGQLPGNPDQARALLRRQVIPQRELIARISEDLRTQNQDAFQ